MRARVKRRQRNRRILIILVAVALVAVFAVSAYYLSLPSALDAFDDKVVSSSQMTALGAAAAPPYGTGGSSLAGEIHNSTGQALVSNGKPIVLFVGEEGCPYCAEMRWSLVLSLMRFGTFTNLAYMTSAYDATDYPTFSFIGSTYTSKYVVLQSYEVLDRGTNTLQTLPSNYSTIFNSLSVNQGVPFVDFGGKYYVPSALLPSSIPGYASYIDYLSSLFGSKNWDQVISSISSGDTLGSLIKAGANVITASICKSITAVGGVPPPSVCQQTPINQLGPLAQPLAPFAIQALSPVTSVQETRRMGW
jgi:uncharacterized protein DUF929